jgi:integrase
MELKLPEILSEEELRKIIEQSKNHQKIAYALGFYNCMRIGEIVSLKSEDINKETKIVWIKQGKGHKDRQIPIAPEVMKGLKYIPLKFKNKKSGIRSLQISFKKICKKVLNRDLHFHCLRHSGITYYLTTKKLSSLAVQRIAGHSRIQTTEMYSHINPQDLVKLVWGDK